MGRYSQFGREEADLFPAVSKTDLVSAAFKLPGNRTEFNKALRSGFRL